MKNILFILVWGAAAFIVIQFIDLAFWSMNFPSDLVNFLAVPCFAAIPGLAILANILIKKLNHKTKPSNEKQN